MTNPTKKAQSDTQVVMTLKMDQPKHQNHLKNLKVRRAFKTLEEAKRHTSKQNGLFVLDAMSHELMNKQKDKIVEQENREETKTTALASSNIHQPHIIMITLLEQLCFMYAKEKPKANQLFKILCNRLSELNIITPLSHLDEMSSLRLQHRAMFNKIMRNAILSLNQGKSLLALPLVGPYLDLSPDDKDIISQHTSRYKLEFQEVCLLGKGGFGSVYKAKNYLDGCYYAVKKIKFKHKKTDTLLKLLREVKALANLHHSNIVGYNAAWLEYDNPFMAAAEKSLPAITQKQEDITAGLSESKDNSTSYSIEFGFDTEEDHNELPAYYPELNGEGLAMKAKLFSSVRVEGSPKILGAGNLESLLHAGSAEVSTSQSVEPGQVPAPKLYIKDEKAATVDFNLSENNCKSHGENRAVEPVHISGSQCGYVSRETNSDKASLSSDFQLIPKFPSPEKLAPDPPLQNKRSSMKKFSASGDNGGMSFHNITFKEDCLSFPTSDLAPSRKGCKEMSSCPSVSFEGSEMEARESAAGVDESSKWLDSVGGPVTQFNGQKVLLGRFYSPVCIKEKSSIRVEAEEVIEPKLHNYDFQSSITLYIQMELCSITLQEWLLDRNTRRQDDIEDESLRAVNMRIFQQVLSGVNFIHSQCLIHRDLKPRNIFLSGKELHVKIGDFGLAKEYVCSQGREEIILMPSQNEDESIPFIDDHTTGVGTSSYASPEQLKSSYYDVKSDMYSLGVILFEMFNVFSTEMERLKEIQKLRKKGRCTKHFVQKWSLQADAIQSLLSSNPSERPSAQDLLNSPLFLSREQQIERLQNIIQQQQKEIENYSKALKEKDKTIREKDLALKEKDQLISLYSRLAVLP